MKCPYCIKQCSKCKKILVAYKNNFRKQKKGKYGLHSECKQCEKQYREENKERIAKTKKEWVENNRES